MINLISIATFFIRLTGFSFLVDAVINSTYLLDYLAAAGSSKPGAAMDLHEFQAFMVLVRVLLLGLLGLVFFAFSKPLVKLFTRGLNNAATEPQSLANTWPPAPEEPKNT